jgi:hypothetical protein
MDHAKGPRVLLLASRKRRKGLVGINVIAPTFITSMWPAAINS